VTVSTASEASTSSPVMSGNDEPLSRTEIQRHTLPDGVDDATADLCSSPLTRVASAAICSWRHASWCQHSAITATRSFDQTFCSLGANPTNRGSRRVTFARRDMAGDSVADARTCGSDDVPINMTAATPLLRRETRPSSQPTKYNYILPCVLSVFAGRAVLVQQGYDLQ